MGVEGGAAEGPDGIGLGGDIFKDLLLLFICLYFIYVAQGT